MTRRYLGDYDAWNDVRHRDHLEEARDLAQGRWPLVVQVRCGVVDGTKACGRKVGQQVLVTSRGPLLVGMTGDGFAAPFRPERLNKADGQRWTPPGLAICVLIDHHPQPPSWWQAECDRGHRGAGLLADVRTALVAGKKSCLTVPIDFDDEGFAFLL